MELLSISEYDFAAFQQNLLGAIDGVPLYQYDNEGDGIVGGFLGALNGSWHKEQDGAEKHKKDTNSNGGHSIQDFINAVENLPEGKYIYKDEEFIKVD